MMTAVFQRIGPFDIVSEIGRGGMATVFLAVDTRTGQRVALKLVPIGTDREAREVLEAEQWGAILHDRFSKVCQHVPAVYEYKTEGQYFYLAMEYVDGHNLSDVIARGPLQPDRAVAIAVQLCRVLELSHEFETTIEQRQFHSLIHGDLKPRNVRLTDDDRLTVLDFGIAKALSLSRRVTRNDFGSMAYLSPERLESDGDVDSHADCWAVGVLLYEMLSGKQPFRADDTRQLEKRITSRQPPELLTERCPVALQAVVSKLLAPQLSDRYNCARAIREDLERFANHQQTEAERQGWPDRVADEGPTRRTRPFDSAQGGPFEVAQGGPASDEAPTQRTRADVKRPATPPPLPPPVAPRTGRAATRKWPRPLRIARALLILVAVMMVSNEACVAASAARITPGVRGRELNELDEVWTAYDRLAERSNLRFGVVRLERALTRQTATLTDRIIDRYRTGGAVVWEPEWMEARRALVRAAALPSAGAHVRASLRYCDGHLHRINGEARKARREFENARLLFSNAVTAFREAAELRPDWPDPFLGLARTFIYGLEDVDRGADALKQAQRRGYTPGERETTQLADGYRRRAESLSRTAVRLKDLPQEQEYLARAEDAYHQALSLYGMLVTADVANSIRLTQRGLKRVTDRLGELSEPTTTADVVVPGDALEMR
jgi:eukaryotic-like serine/threonine-protein kinase